jgi:antitoxin component YwqK of YwqJK toxin-antitoxin module
MLFLVGMVFFPFFTIAQNIGLPELIAFLSRPNWESVNQTLMNKGWNFYESSKEGDESYGEIQWSYQKDYFSNKAKGWLWLYTENNVPIKVTLQFHNKAIYNVVVQSIAKSGYKKLPSEITNEGLVVEYYNAKHTIRVTISTSDDDYSIKTIYFVSVEKHSRELEAILNYKPKNGMVKDDDQFGTLECECTYKNGVLNGPYKKYAFNELVEQGTYVNGKKNGKCKSYVDGRLDHEGVYKHDEPIGLQTFYFYDADGKLNYKSVGILKDELKEGLWNDYSRIEGKEVIIQFFTYEDGQLHGKFKKIEDNDVIIGGYKNGDLHGLYQVYSDYQSKEGELLYGNLDKTYLREEGVYENGKKTGLWKIYDKNKNIVDVIEY